MKCQGNFIFKTFSYREGGTIKDDKGNDIKYFPAYILKVDEIEENGEINERKFKITEDKKNLIEALNKVDAYQKIILEFNVKLYSTKVSLDLINALIDNNYDID